MNDDLEIKFVDDWDIDEIVELYKSGGWWNESYDKKGISKLIKGSYKFAVIIEKKTNKAIGMGRLLSDGVSDAYLQDIVIHTSYRGRGLGKKLVNFLVDHCKSKGINWVGLIAEPDQDNFYKPIGFKQMKKYIPMKYKNGE